MSENPGNEWTSIPVRSDTRDKVGVIKRDDESWTDTLERLVQESADIVAQQDRE
jgi:hypothetical protein